MEPDNEMLRGEYWDYYAEKAEPDPDQAYEKYVSEKLYQDYLNEKSGVADKADHAEASRY